MGQYLVGTWVLAAPWVVAAGAALVAWRNHKAGRSDLRGASRLGAGVMGCSLVGWVLTAHHVPTFQYFPALSRAVGAALSVGVLGGLLYMAVEPFVRRRWPESLIAWTRLLSGRVRDPLVGSHLLIGTACGLGLTIWLTLKIAVLLSQGLVTQQNWQMLQGPGWALSALLWSLIWLSVTKVLVIFVLFLFARVIFRRDWAATVAVVLLSNSLPVLENPRPIIEMAFEIPAAALSVWLLFRMGVLPAVVAFFVAEALVYSPLTTNLSAWYCRTHAARVGCGAHDGDLVVRSRPRRSAAVRRRICSNRRVG